MNTNDLLLRWSHMSLAQIEAEIASGQNEEAARMLLGDEAVDAILLQAAAPPESAFPPPVDFSPEAGFPPLADFPPQAGFPPAVSMGIEQPRSLEREAVVLLPGMMGSQLSSIRGVTSLMWINPLVILNGEGRFLALGQDGARDNCPEIEMVAVSAAPFVYTAIGLALKREFDLFEFPYDWRRAAADSAAQLRDCLERWADGSERKFTLVGHSMGGLVARIYLARYPQEAERRVKRLVTIGTLGAGAVTAIQTLFTGNDLMAKVDWLNGSNRIADVVRSMPGLYNLLPPPPHLFPSGVPYPANWYIYEAPKWHVPGIRQEYLDATHAMHHLLAHADPQIPITQIAGCNLQTMTGLTGDFSAFHGAVNAALAHLPEHLPPLTPSFVDRGEESGDGTVPLWSARVKGAEVFYIREKHVQLAGNGRVIQAVKCLVHGDRCPLEGQVPPAQEGAHTPLSFGVEGDGSAGAGMEFSVPMGVEETTLPAAADTPEAWAERLRSGNPTREDLLNLQFAL